MTYKTSLNKKYYNSEYFIVAVVSKRLFGDLTTITSPTVASSNHWISKATLEFHPSGNLFVFKQHQVGELIFGETTFKSPYAIWMMVS